MTQRWHINHIVISPITEGNKQTTGEDKTWLEGTKGANLGKTESLQMVNGYVDTILNANQSAVNLLYIHFNHSVYNRADQHLG